MSQSPTLKHAIESFEHGLEHYLDGSDRSRKFALLHIDQAIELFLKEKVIQLGKTIYKTDGSTINFHEAFNSLKALNIPEQPRLEELHDLRNVIQHKGLTPDPASAQFYVDVAYQFVKRFISEELGTPLDKILSREYRALLEGQALLFEKTSEVIEAYKEAASSPTPQQKIISGFTVLNIAVDLLGDHNTGKVLFRRTIRESAKSMGYDQSLINSHLDVVMRLRNQVVHSEYEPTASDAEEFLRSVRKILEMLGCKF